MNIKKFIDSISFRFVQPETKLPIGYGDFRKYLGLIGISLDRINTVLPVMDKIRRRSLHEVSKVPRMSTVAVGAIINQLVMDLPPSQVFLNVGVWNGFTFLSGLVNNPEKNCIGVDNFSRFGGPREAFLKRFNQYKSSQHHFHDLDYVEYFAKIHHEPIGFYLFDGPHTYEHQLKGLQLAEPFFADQCYILVDDTNGDAARQGTMAFIQQRSDKYRVLLDQRTSRNCHPTYWNGLILFQKNG